MIYEIYTVVSKFLKMCDLPVENSLQYLVIEEICGRLEALGETLFPPPLAGVASPI